MVFFLYTIDMKLSNLLKNINTVKIIGSTDIIIQSLSQDTREKSLSNSIYFAISGTQVDGHKYIQSAIDKGSVAIVCNSLPEKIDQNISYIQVDNVALVIGEIASNFYNNPSQKLKVIAVTGTNGKTSIAVSMAQTLENMNQKTLLLSTAGDFLGGEKIEITRKASSSLENIELHKVLKMAVDSGVKYCCLEATSIALDQYRMAGIDIDCAIFTNLADDHLDYHGTMNKYAEAKKKLFDGLKKEALAITNSDDEYGEYMIKDTQSRVKTVSSKKGDFTFTINKINIYGMTITINEQKYSVPLIGKFNAYNISMVNAALIFFDFNYDQISNAISQIDGIPGRMQIVQNNRNILALVDYAHSADALKNVLTTLEQIPHENIITVIGCGGDRDTTKRASMAGVTQQLSDTVIYTADNPRTEDLQNIFDDMKKGINPKFKNYHFIESRKSAIKKAVEISEPHGIILVAGKGHEDYQIIGTEKIPFDDTQILNKYLNNKI